MEWFTLGAPLWVPIMFYSMVALFFIGCAYLWWVMRQNAHEQ